jgi:hypothetical protein
MFFLNSNNNQNKRKLRGTIPKILIARRSQIHNANESTITDVKCSTSNVKASASIMFQKNQRNNVSKK